MRKGVFVGLIGIFLIVGGAFAQQVGFTQEDRERLIRLEATLKTFMEQVDKRFEQMDKRIADLRADMNKRFEQVDKRFEQVDRRFEQVTNFLWMLVAIFTALTAANIGFAYWDRRTIIRRARDEAIERIEREGRLVDLIGALRELAKEDKKLAEILRGFRLM